MCQVIHISVFETYPKPVVGSAVMQYDYLPNNMQFFVVKHNYEKYFYEEVNTKLWTWRTNSN